MNPICIGKGSVHRCKCINPFLPHRKKSDAKPPSPPAPAPSRSRTPRFRPRRCVALQPSTLPRAWGIGMVLSGFWSMPPGWDVFFSLPSIQTFGSRGLFMLRKATADAARGRPTSGRRPRSRPRTSTRRCLPLALSVMGWDMRAANPSGKGSVEYLGGRSLLFFSILFRLPSRLPVGRRRTTWCCGRAAASTSSGTPPTPLAADLQGVLPSSSFPWLGRLCSLWDSVSGSKEENYFFYSSCSLSPHSRRCSSSCSGRSCWTPPTGC